MKRSKVNIGVEIEINSTNGMEIDNSLWVLEGEHCGYELRSYPCKTPGQIKRLIKSIEKMSNTSFGTFDNTGTHIHIDFLNDANVSETDLNRMTVLQNADGTWNNPLGTGKRYMWVCPSGELWKSPKDYLKSKGAVIKDAEKYYIERGNFVESVKRFLLLGVRFADVLFAIQHPSRRFNKYCHTISGWDEDFLMACKTVHEICKSPRLLQMHRRHMFNPLAFRKFGTLEIRMIKGTLDHKEIWEQIFLFGKMAQLAKSNDYIPKSTKNGLNEDFVLLMGACKIHGKIRRRLTKRFKKYSKANKKKWTARCFACEVQGLCKDFYDHGLSRPYCSMCHKNYTSCIYCGYNLPRGSGYLFDNKLEDGRYLCNGCSTSGVKKKIKNAEKTGILYLMGQQIGSGVDSKGLTALRRMRAIFK